MAELLSAEAVWVGAVRGRYFRENFAQGDIDLVQIVRDTISVYDASYAATADEGGHHLVSCDERDLVSKGLAVLPASAQPT